MIIVAWAAFRSIVTATLRDWCDKIFNNHNPSNICYISYILMNQETVEQVTLDIDGEDGNDFSPTNKVRFTNQISKQSSPKRIIYQTKYTWQKYFPNKMHLKELFPKQSTLAGIISQTKYTLKNYFQTKYTWKNHFPKKVYFKELFPKQSRLKIIIFQTSCRQMNNAQSSLKSCYSLINR